MFTGLITAVGSLRRVERRGSDAVFVIECAYKDYVQGESIAVDGVCLTARAFEAGAFIADASSETLTVTTLGAAERGSRVHLERALRASDRLGGHFVSGHVDGIGALVSRVPSGESIRLAFSIPATLARQVVGKGSIAIDGVSLTINSIGGTPSAPTVEVMIVPHTQTETKLAELGVGARVNVETDVLAKYVERMLGLGRDSAHTESPLQGVTLDLLRRQGYT